MVIVIMKDFGGFEEGNSGISIDKQHIFLQINYTLGSESLVPYLLVFNYLTGFPE